jgi:hypothetical protein
VKLVVALVIVLAVPMVVACIKSLFMMELPFMVFPFISKVVPPRVKTISFEAINDRLSPTVKFPPVTFTLGIKRPSVISVPVALIVIVAVSNGV